MMGLPSFFKSDHDLWNTQEQREFSIVVHQSTHLVSQSSINIDKITEQ